MSSNDFPQLLRSISTNSNNSATFSQEFSEYLKTEQLDVSCFSSSDDGAVATDLAATSRVPDMQTYPGNFGFEVNGGISLNLSKSLNLN